MTKLKFVVEGLSPWAVDFRVYAWNGDQWVHSGNFEAPVGDYEVLEGDEFELDPEDRQ